MTSMPGMVSPPEGHAQIDHQPVAVMAIEVEIHADLAASPKRQEQQVIGARHQPAVGHVHRERFIGQS
ncbi:MAG: hypothetical protein U1E97_05110 [Alphaproteobacteria bacterium]